MFCNEIKLSNGSKLSSCSSLMFFLKYFFLTSIKIYGTNLLLKYIKGNNK